MSAEEVALETRDAFLGTDVGTLRRLDLLLNVRVRYPDEVRGDPDRFASLPLVSAAGRDVTIGTVARLTPEEAPTVLERESLQPIVVVGSDIEERDLGGVVRELQRKLENVHPPTGYRIELGGRYASQVEASRNLALVALVGVLLVLVVLVAQLRSLRPALAVLLTTPLALVGALAALWITGIPLDASSSMGLVLLVGLVVKNGILLIELAEERARDGVPYTEAITVAAERRLRPIAMTTLATLAGLAPLALAIGAGSELQRPLAVAVLGGLSLSAAASMVVLPSLAVLFAGRTRANARSHARRTPEP
jgi:multidrug efflux pump subunit AcrB